MQIDRVSNIMYPRGSVIFVKFQKGSKYDFLHLRPLIVVSNQTDKRDTLVCTICRSRDWAGIEISLKSYWKKGWIGDTQYSVVTPDYLITVNINEICDWAGVIAPPILKAIDKAMAYHLGLSDEIPEYMQDFHEKYLAPRYNMATEDTTSVRSCQRVSPKERNRIFHVDALQYFGEHRPKYEDKIKGTISDPIVEPDSNNDEQIPEVSEVTTDTPSTEIVMPDLIQDRNPCPVSPINSVDRLVESVFKSKDTDASYATLPTTSRRNPNVTVLNRVSQDQIETSKVRKSKNTIADETLHSIEHGTLDMLDQVQILLKQIDNAESITRFGLPLSRVREELEQYYYGGKKYYNKETATPNRAILNKRINDKLCKMERNWRFLSEAEQVICLLHLNYTDYTNISPTFIRDKYKGLIKLYNLDFTDGRKWRGLEKEHLKLLKRLHDVMKPQGLR